MQSQYETPFAKFGLNHWFPEFKRGSFDLSCEEDIEIHIDEETENEYLETAASLKSILALIDNMEIFEIPPNKSIVICKVCRKEFLNTFHVQRHFRAAHYRLRPFRCEFCPKAFGRSENRNYHELRHLREHSRFF